MHIGTRIMDWQGWHRIAQQSHEIGNVRQFAQRFIVAAIYLASLLPQRGGARGEGKSFTAESAEGKRKR